MGTRLSGLVCTSSAALFLDKWSYGQLALSNLPANTFRDSPWAGPSWKKQAEELLDVLHVVQLLGWSAAGEAWRGGLRVASSA